MCQVLLPGVETFCQRGQGHRCNLQEGQLLEGSHDASQGLSVPDSGLAWALTSSSNFLDSHCVLRRKQISFPMRIIINVCKSKGCFVGVPLTWDQWSPLSTERATPGSWTEEINGVGKEGSGEHCGNIHRTSIGEEGKSDIRCTFFEWDFTTEAGL